MCEASSHDHYAAIGHGHTIMQTHWSYAIDGWISVLFYSVVCVIFVVRFNIFVVVRQVKEETPNETRMQTNEFHNFIDNGKEVENAIVCFIVYEAVYLIAAVGIAN